MEKYLFNIEQSLHILGEVFDLPVPGLKILNIIVMHSLGIFAAFKDCFVCLLILSGFYIFMFKIICLLFSLGIHHSFDESNPIGHP